MVTLIACSVVCIPGWSDSGQTSRFLSKNGGWVSPARTTLTWPVARLASRISTLLPGPYPWAHAAKWPLTAGGCQGLGYGVPPGLLIECPILSSRPVAESQAYTVK